MRYPESAERTKRYCLPRPQREKSRLPLSDDISNFGWRLTPVPIKIEVVLTDINAEVENRCGHRLDWHTAEKRLLSEGEADAANPPLIVRCLRLETEATYNAEEDQFEAKPCYSHSPNAEPGELDKVSKEVKRLFGFLHLRAVRTGSRALSLERGSLLDVILRLRDSRAGLWEKAIERLRALDIEQDATHLQPALASIEARLGRYIASDVDGRTTKLHVSQLTREHLRKTMAFFLAMSTDQTPVPFQQVGTGTLNVLVLALLSFIAELKLASVIFAMEEPEIAVPRVIGVDMTPDMVSRARANALKGEYQNVEFRLARSSTCLSQTVSPMR